MLCLFESVEVDDEEPTTIIIRSEDFISLVPVKGNKSRLDYRIDEGRGFCFVKSFPRHIAMSFVNKVNQL